MKSLAYLTVFILAFGIVELALAVPSILGDAQTFTTEMDPNRLTIKVGGGETTTTAWNNQVKTRIPNSYRATVLVDGHVKLEDAPSKMLTLNGNYWGQLGALDKAILLGRQIALARASNQKVSIVFGTLNLPPDHFSVGHPWLWVGPQDSTKSITEGFDLPLDPTKITFGRVYDAVVEIQSPPISDKDEKAMREERFRILNLLGRHEEKISSKYSYSSINIKRESALVVNYDGLPIAASNFHAEDQIYQEELAHLKQLQSAAIALGVRELFLRVDEVTDKFCGEIKFYSR